MARMKRVKGMGHWAEGKNSSPLLPISSPPHLPTSLEK